MSALGPFFHTIVEEPTYVLFIGSTVKRHGFQTVKRKGSKSQIKIVGLFKVILL